MGKITSIYLTENEVKQLEKFCEENECTQYSALKTALRELLHKPTEENEAPTVEEEEIAEDSAEAEKSEKAEKERRILKRLLKAMQ